MMFCMYEDNGSTKDYVDGCGEEGRDQQYRKGLGNEQAKSYCTTSVADHLNCMIVSFKEGRGLCSMPTQRANEDRNEVENSFLEDFPSVQTCADAKTNDEDDCSAKGRSVAVELEVNSLLSTILITQAAERF